MKAGAVDFLTKPVDKLRLLKAVNEALARNSGVRSMDAELKSLQQRRDALSARELEVYKRVVAGVLNKQIAVELGTSERTIKVQRASVMEKMQANSLPELVRMASLLDCRRASARAIFRLRSRAAWSRRPVSRLPLRAVCFPKVQLPVFQAADDGPMQLPWGGALQKSPMPVRQPIVLVVDDDADMNQALESVLKAAVADGDVLFGRSGPRGRRSRRHGVPSPRRAFAQHEWV